MGKLDWSKAKRNEAEPAAPKGHKPVPLRGGSHVAPGKVKHLADMTPAERARVMAQIRPPGTR